MYANAVEPIFSPPTEERRLVSKAKPLCQWKYRRCLRGAPPFRLADRRLQWRFLQFRANAPPRVISWRGRRVANRQSIKKKRMGVQRERSISSDTVISR